MNTAESKNPTRAAHAGINYIEFIHKGITLHGAQTYLEIGLCNGHSIADIACDCIAIDPAPVVSRNIIGKKKMLSIFQETSDAFFAKRNPTQIFGKPVDISFLDGMHLFEYLLRDFYNIEKYSRRNSIVFLHDCLPLNFEMGERVHAPSKRSDKTLADWWTGDVWKVLPILKRFRPELRIVSIDCPPTGLVAITNLNPDSNVLQENYFSIVDEYKKIPTGEKSFNDLYANLEIVDSKAIVTRDGFGNYFAP